MTILVIVGCVALYVFGLVCSPPNGYASWLETVAGFSLFFALVGAMVWAFFWYVVGEQAGTWWVLLVASTVGSMSGVFVNWAADPGYE